MQTNASVEDIVAKYARIVNRNVATWETILWDNSAKKMVMRNGTLLYYLLVEMFNSHILDDKEKNRMVDRYALIFNMEREQAREAIVLKYADR